MALECIQQLPTIFLPKTTSLEHCDLPYYLKAHGAWDLLLWDSRLLRSLVNSWPLQRDWLTSSFVGHTLILFAFIKEDRMTWNVDSCPAFTYYFMDTTVTALTWMMVCQKFRIWFCSVLSWKHSCGVTNLFSSFFVVNPGYFCICSILVPWIITLSPHKNL